MEFQVRISAECMYYMKLLEEIYSENNIGKLTNGILLTRAYEDIENSTNWKQVYTDNSISLSNIEYDSRYGKVIKAEISEEMNENIRNLKSVLAKEFSLSNVTIGATVKYIFKAAVLLYKKNIANVGNIDEEFLFLKTELEKIVAPINYDELHILLEKTKKRLNRG